MEILQLNQLPPKTPIKNLESLPRGVNAPYLECIRAHNGDIVAKKWRRTVPVKYEVLICF